MPAKLRSWNTKKSPIAYADYVMVFGLEQEDGSVITLMAQAHPLHPITVYSMYHTHTHTHIYINVYIYIYMPCVMAAF